MAKPLGPTVEFFRRRDEWRKHPTMMNQWRHATPGLGIALIAFGIYVVGEAAYNKIYAPKSHSHSCSCSCWFFYFVLNFLFNFSVIVARIVGFGLRFKLNHYSYL